MASAFKVKVSGSPKPGVCTKCAASVVVRMETLDNRPGLQSFAILGTLENRWRGSMHVCSMALACQGIVSVSSPVGGTRGTGGEAPVDVLFEG